MVNEPYVTIEELANHFSVCVSTVRKKWIKNDLIPVLKLNGIHRFKISEVEQALRNIGENKVEVDPRQMEINFDPNEDL